MADTRIQKWIWTKLFSWQQQFVWDDIAKKIWLTRADQREFQAGWSYSKPAQALIDKYKTGGRVPLVQAPTSTTLSTGQTVDNTIMWMSNQNATYWKDPAVDNIIASQYVNSKDKAMETYTQKIWMETGIYADIQNIDTKVLETYKILWMSDQDIFSRQDISAEEKVAMSNQRKNIATNRITQLRKIQQAKQDEIKTLAEYEEKKAKEQQEAYKDALAYMKEVNDAKKFDLDIKKYNLDVAKTNAEWEFKAEELNLKKERAKTDKKTTYFKWIKNSALLDAPDWTILKSRLGETTNPNWWKECGEYVNDAMWGSIPRFWNDYNSKLKVADEQYWTIWAAAVWNPGNNKFGHVWIIIWEQGDNWVIKSSNLKNDWAISTDIIPKDTIEWYKNTTNIDKTPDLNFETYYDYLNSTVENVGKLITPETAQKILISDMESFSLPADKIKQLKELWKVPQNIIDDYTSIAIAKKKWSTYDDSTLVSEIDKLDLWKLPEDKRMNQLVRIALAGKLNNSDWWLFEWGWLTWDWKWYDAIQDYFKDPNDAINKANQIAADIKKQYNIN